MNKLLQTIRESLKNWRTTLVIIRKKILAGILVSIPLIVTIRVLALAYDFINGISDPFLRKAGVHIPGLGFIVTILLLIGVGFMATNVLGQRFLDAIERLLLRIPLVTTIYTIVKQVIDSFRAFNNASNFKRVVYIDYPSAGCRLIALVTNQFYDTALGMEMTTVVIPTAPNPMTGLIVVVESSRLVESSLTIEEATKLIVSAGLVAPKRKV